MSNFRLIKKLSTPEIVSESETSHIQYQRYELNGEDGPVAVLIPINECTNFESSLDQISGKLYSHNIRELLRNHRGIKDKV